MSPRFFASGTPIADEATIGGFNLTPTICPTGVHSDVQIPNNCDGQWLP